MEDLKKLDRLTLNEHAIEQQRISIQAKFGQKLLCYLAPPTFDYIVAFVDDPVG